MVAAIKIPNTFTFSNVRQWEGIATGGSIESFEPDRREAVIATVQFSGTFAGGTVVTMQASNDDVNFFTLKDRITGSNISVTAAGLFEISTVARFIRPSISSGTADSVNVFVSLVG